MLNPVRTFTVLASGCPITGNFSSPLLTRASLIAQMVKRLPTMWETQVQFLGWDDPLEKEMATYSSTLAWKIPGTVAYQDYMD